MIISSKNSKTKVPMSILSIVLCIALITAVIPHFLYNSYFTQDSVAANTSQTKYANITEFQEARWTEIQNSVFNQDYTSVQDANTIKDLSVNEGNPYFNWTNTSNMQGYDSVGNEIEGGLKKYSGKSEAVTSSDTITENYADSYVNYQDETINVTSQATYTVYDVYTADQFAYVLKLGNQGNVIKLNLCADIDMGGADNKQFSTVGFLSGTMYIEGNGHTVYNLKMYGESYYFGIYNFFNSNSKLIAKNLGFQSVMLLHYYPNFAKYFEPSAGLFFGYAANSVNPTLYLSNVHMNEAFFQQNTHPDQDSQGLAFLGGKGFYNKFFVDNCSTSKGYIYMVSVI